jgi:hypothetical protein
MSRAAVTIMDQFEKGWSCPSPTAFDEFLATDVVLKQPFIPTVHGRTECHKYLARLLLFAPTLQGRVLSWSSTGNVLFIEIEFAAPRTRRRVLRWNAADRVLFDEQGVVRERVTYMDPLELTKQIARSPRLTLRWLWSRAVPDPITRWNKLTTRDMKDGTDSRQAVDCPPLDSA